MKIVLCKVCWALKEGLEHILVNSRISWEKIQCNNYNRKVTAPVESVVVKPHVVGRGNSDPGGPCCLGGVKTGYQTLWSLLPLISYGNFLLLLRMSSGKKPFGAEYARLLLIYARVIYRFPRFPSFLFLLLFFFPNWYCICLFCKVYATLKML